MPGDQVGDVEVAVVRSDLGEARRGVLFLDLQQFLADDAEPFFAGADDLFEVGDVFDQLFHLGAQGFDGQSGELVQTHVEDGVDLRHGKFEPGDEGFGRGLAVGGLADDLHHFIDVVQSLEEPFEDVRPGFGLLEFEDGAAEHHVEAVVDEGVQHLDQVHGHGAVVVHHQHGAAHDGLELGVGEDLVEHHSRVGAALHVHHHPGAGPVAGLVLQIGDAGDAFFADEFGDPGHLLGLVDAEGHFADDDLFLAVLFDDVGPGTDPDAAPARQVELAQGVAAADDGSRGEVRAGQKLHELIHRGFGVVQQVDRGVDDFAQIVGGDVGRHAHADAGAAVDQQLGELGRKHRGFHVGLVEGGHHVHGLFFDVGQHLVGNAFHAALGVAAGGGGVAVNRPEVALALDEGHPHGKGLGQTDQRVVDGGVAVGVIITHHVAHHLGALDRGVGFGDPHLAHGVKDTPVHGFEAVAHVGNGPAHIDAQGVLHVGGVHDLVDVDREVFSFQFAHNFCSVIYVENLTCDPFGPTPKVSA